MPVGFMAGYNLAVAEKTIKKLSSDPFRYSEYEEYLKNKRNDSKQDFFEYYAGKPGRLLAYKFMDNSKNWK